MKITIHQTVALKLKLKNAKVTGGPDIDREATGVRRGWCPHQPQYRK